MKASACKNAMNHWVKNVENSTLLTKHLKGSNYLQLATVDLNGLPSCRTVVYRGLLPCLIDGIGTVNCLKMITDQRSRKVEHLRANNHAELVWWLPHTSEQYIFNGKIFMVDEFECRGDFLRVRNEMWSKLSETAQQQFYSPHVPGSLYSEGQVNEDHILKNPSQKLERNEFPPHNFVTLLLIPEKVKYLRLNDNYSQVDTLAKSGDNDMLCSRVLFNDEVDHNAVSSWSSIRTHN